MRSRANKLNRARNGGPKAIAVIAILFQWAGTAVVGIVVLVSASFRARSPGPEDAPGSGIVMRTEVTTLWIPRPFAMWPKVRPADLVTRSPEALQTELERRGLNDAWYALTYRYYQVNGDSAEITQVRRISEAYARVEGIPGHLDGNRRRTSAES